MSKSQISRRGLLGGAGAASAVSLFAGPWKENRVWAQARRSRIRIGITSDASGQYANSGASDERGIADGDRRVQRARAACSAARSRRVHIDTETTPATGSRVAERMISPRQCGFLSARSIPASPTPSAQVAQKYGVIYLNTNSSSPTEAGENCHRVKFVWDGNGTNFAKAAVKSAIELYGQKWVLLTNDYVWGHDTAAATKKLLTASGGKVIEEILVPQGTRDFSSAPAEDAADLARRRRGGDRRRRPEGDAQAGGAARHGRQARLDQQSAGLAGCLRPAARRPVRRVRHHLVLQASICRAWPTSSSAIRRCIPRQLMRVPGNVFHNAYMSTRELLRAIERAGSTNNIKSSRRSKATRCRRADRMQHHDAWIDPDTHQVQQTIYLATANVGAEGQGRYVQDPVNAAPEDVRDTDSAAEAASWKRYEQTPTFDA